MCGGVLLFPAEEEGWDVGVPEQFVRTDEQHGLDSPLPAPHMWTIANVHDSRIAPLSIDLRPERLGRCYDAFWDIHASPGNQPVAALSFSELLTVLFRARGMRPSFYDEAPYGDAWDD